MLRVFVVGRPVAALGLKRRAPSRTSVRSLLVSGRSFHSSFPSKHSSNKDADTNSGPLVTVHWLQKDGTRITTREKPGMNLLEVAHKNQIDLEGACEGSLACSTCHVVVTDPEVYRLLPEPTDEENDMLDLAFGLTETYAKTVVIESQRSRLGCQVVLNPALDGMEVQLPAATRNMADVPISFTAPMGTSQTSQWKVPRDQRGVRDYAYYPESVSIATLKEREATNFSFLGRVLTVTKNRPLREPDAAQKGEPGAAQRGDVHVRHGLYIAALTGSSDAPQPPYLEVTLWDSLAREHCSIQVGQIVYIHNITTTSPNTNKPHDRIIANASPRLGSEIINVSELSGLLSPKLLPLSSSLAECQKRGWASCIADVYVTLKKCDTFQIHLRCRRVVVEKKLDVGPPPMPMQQPAKPSYHPQPYPQRLVDNSSRSRSDSPNHSFYSPSPPGTPLSKFWCGFCDCIVPLSELDFGYSVSWLIQDQFGVKTPAVASPATNERLLMIPAREFAALSNDAQFDHTLQFCMPPGMSLRALLTIATPNGELMTRIESFTDDPPSHPYTSDVDTMPPPSFASASASAVQ